MSSGDMASGALWDRGAGAGRERVWRQARRHSRHVRALRVVLPVITGLIVAAMIVSLRGLPTPAGNLGLGGIGLSGSSLTMEKPHLTGYGSNGMSYDVTAARALQDLTNPDMVQLETISGRVKQPGDRWATLEAVGGIYNSKAESLHLSEDIRIVVHDGKRAFLETADVDLRTQEVVSDQPVRLEMPGARVRADSMHISAGGEEVTLRGGVVMNLRLNGGPLQDSDQ